MHICQGNVVPLGNFPGMLVEAQTQTALGFGLFARRFADVNQLSFEVQSIYPAFWGTDTFGEGKKGAGFKFLYNLLPNAPI